MATHELNEVALILRAGDDVATALVPLRAGDALRHDEGSVTLRWDVPPGHKVALRAVPQGGEVRVA